jgi:hypothetical protein
MGWLIILVTGPSRIVDASAAMSPPDARFAAKRER